MQERDQAQSRPDPFRVHTVAERAGWSTDASDRAMSGEAATSRSRAHRPRSNLVTKAQVPSVAAADTRFERSPKPIDYGIHGRTPARLS